MQIVMQIATALPSASTFLGVLIITLNEVLSTDTFPRSILTHTETLPASSATRRLVRSNPMVTPTYVIQVKYKVD